MATASASLTTKAPVLLRARNFRWYWNSAADPSASDQNWQKYTDVDNEIIEDGLKAHQSIVELDCHRIIDLKNNVQCNKNERNRPRPIKRVELKEDRSNTHPREERFSFPITLAPASSTSHATNDDKIALYLGNGQFTKAYAYLHIEPEEKTVADVVEEASQGIIREGATLGKEKEAQWLADQLRIVKHFGDKLLTSIWTDIPLQVGETCVHLYTKESFWYRLINQTLRQCGTVTSEQVKNIGPFCYLLHKHLEKNPTTDVLTTYRGLTLTDEERKAFMKETMTFTAFTSTSRSRVQAEQFGDTLFIIDFNVKCNIGNQNQNVRCVTQISHLSDFPSEDEVLVWPWRVFHFVKDEFDSVKKKHVVYLKSAASNY